MTFQLHQSVFTRPDVALEPLVNQYYAWLNLVAPAPAAMNFAKLHLPLLKSFREAPHMHRRSARDPKLRGGMFVDLPEGTQERVDDLIDAIGASPLRSTAAAIDELATALPKFADGFDLTPCYERVPTPLRGLVEFVYDLDDQARLRFGEKMFYRKHFDESTHAVDLARCTSDERPFAMTTPRFPGAGHLQTRMPLRDARIDALFETTRTARPFGELCDLFEVGTDDLESFATLFAADCALHEQRNAPDGNDRVRYFGHACVAVESGGVTVMTDPFISDKAGDDRYAHADVPDVVDYVIITHGHQDHLELGTLLKLRHKIGTVVVPKTASGALQDPSLALCLRALGFARVVEMEPGDTLDCGPFSIVACPFVGEHCDLDIGAKLTYAVRTGSQSLYFGADNRGVDAVLFEHVHDLVGDIDTVFLGMECDGAPLTWLYGPLFSRRVDQRISRSRKLNGSDAIEAMRIVRGVRAKKAYVYAMGREPWLGFVMATSYTPESYQLQQIKSFIVACADIGVPASELYGRADLS